MVIAALVLLLGAGSAVGETDVDAPKSLSAAKKATLSWSAFSCMYFAQESGRSAEEMMRFLRLGYSSGKFFIDAVRGGDVSNDHINQNVPIGFIWAAREGLLISDDFALGVVYRDAIDAAREKLKAEIGGSLIDVQEEAKKLIANNLFNSGNCTLIYELGE